LGEKITIAYLVRPAEGGIKSHLLTLLAGLDRSRFEPVVIGPPDTSLFDELVESGCGTIPLDLTGDLSPVRDLKSIARLRGILRRLKPDILHIHSAKAGLVGRIAASTLLHRPKIVLTMHSFVFDERTGPRKRAVVAFVERRLARVTDRIIAVSNALRDEFVAQMSIRPDLVEVIPNGIEFRDIPKSARDDERPMIGTVARLAPQKGVDTFIRAAALIHETHPSARFTIIGDGPLRKSLQALANGLGINDCMEFLGFRSDALEIVSTFDVFVLSSTWETFGLTLVEALSQGVPVVASNVGGIPEIIDGEKTGLLAESGDPNDFAAKIRRFLDDKNLAARTAQAGNESVRRRFDARKMVADTTNLYQRLMNRH
jgi:glycosyltransferase involved in cell wall biosynthesis